jgi:endonuclease/exonuclease/phosphatase family metal-dependent hydrolase
MTAPFAIIANVLLVLIWLFFANRKWRLVIPLLALGFSYRIIPSIFGLHPFAQHEMDPGPGKIKVMHWNVHGMGIFDRPADRTTDDKIIQLIHDESPDILCMPEFYTVYNNALKPYSTQILEQFGFKEFRFKYDNSLGAKIFLGIAIFSRFPISNYHSHSLHTRDNGDVDVQLMQCDVHLPKGAIVRLFATHLQSFTLSDNEKSFLEEVSRRDSSIAVSRSKSFVRRFAGAFLKRSIQADSAAAIIAKSPYPVILCGDLNDLPASYSYERMRGNLRDVFVDKGFGIDQTYNLLAPTLRIDYIFYDHAALKLLGYRSPYTKLSDHNPVIANFQLREQ